MSRVELEENSVELDGFVVEDPVLVELLRDLDPKARAQRVADALEIGARVLIREQTGADIDWIRGEFDRIQAETMAKIAGLLAADEGANPLADFKAGAMEAFRQMAQQLTQALREMSGHVAGLEKEVEGLRTERESAAALEDERERGTAKGRPFEEAVAMTLDVFASACGDVCEHVGDVTGPVGRAGDVVVEIDAASGPTRGRIVFEAKTGRLTRPEAVRQLDEAIEARNADFGVLVVAGADKLPARTRALREYGGDKMLCVVDSDAFTANLQLETAYSLARARILLRRDAGEQVDASAITEAVERTLQALEDIRRVKQSLTGAQTSIESAKTMIDGLVTQARAQLAALGELASY